MTKNPVLFKTSEPKWSKAFSRFRWIISSSIEQGKQYGFGVGWYGLLWWLGVYSRMLKISVLSIKPLTKGIDSYFESKYGDIISKYKNNGLQYINKQQELKEDYPIWTFWWQGEKNMPPIVSACYTYIKTNNKNVFLLTKDNIHKYVNLPEGIYEKVEKGEISYTHLSDILRLTLLAEKGGMWIDTTCFNPYTIPQYAKDQIFYSPHDRQKQQRMKGKYAYWCDSGGWRSWNIGTSINHNPLFMFCRDMIIKLAVNEKCFPNYFMVDCLICYAYRKFKWVTELIDSMPNFNTKCSDLFLLCFNTNKIYNEEYYKKLIENDWIFKLTYKTVWLKEVDGEPTFYGKLFSNNIK